MPPAVDLHLAEEIQELQSLLESPALTAQLAQFAALEPWLRQQQLEITRIPAPTGLEGRRAEWLLRQFQALGLQEAGIDAVGNVIGLLPGRQAEAPLLAVTAHLDTVFPPRTVLQPTLTNGLFHGPGIADNGAGLAALLGLLRVLCDHACRTWRGVLFVGNVGEEGEGNLRGMRHLFGESPWRDRIGRTLVVDGSGTEHITAQALGSKRLKLSFHGQGGHSWSNAGGASAVHALARVAYSLLNQIVPVAGHSALNLGAVEGGSSINTIAATASLKLDLRSTEDEELAAMVKSVRRICAAGVAEENALARHGRVEARIEVIGDRPAGQLAPESRLFRALTAVDATLNIHSHIQRSSTDANIPLSLGREAVALGGGGRSGGMHTLQEWFDPCGRELGLKRLFLLLQLLAQPDPGGAPTA